MIEHASTPLLAGALSGFALADVLQLLELGHRTGVLVVDGGPLGGGSVWLRDGRVAEVGRVAGVSVAGVSTDPHNGRPPLDCAAAVGALLDLPAGRWAFHIAEPVSAPERTEAPSPEGVRISAILMDAARRRDERTRVAPRAAAPDADVPQLCAQAEDGDDPAALACLTAADLHVLAEIDGVRDVGAIAAAARRHVDRVCEAIDTLRALGVVRRRDARAGAGPYA